MRYLFGFVLSLCAVALLLPTGGEADASPFLKRLRCRGASCQLNQACPTEYQIVTGPSAESRTEAQHVPQPWLQHSETKPISSQLPDTVLEPVPGTGSPSLIGPKIPDKIVHTLDPATVKALTEALKQSLQGVQPGSIIPTLEDGTQQRLSRVSMLLEVLLWLGTGVLGSSAAGRVISSVAPVVRGLLSALAAASAASITAAPTSSLPTPTPSSAVSPAAPVSTGKPNT